MTTTRAAPLTDGQTITALAGPVTITVQAVRVGHAYHCSIRYASTGFEIPELSRSYPTEVEARRSARVATTLFRSGWTVNDVLDLIATFAPTA